MSSGGEIPMTPQGPWHPVCDDCIGNEAVKTIGTYWPADVRCNVCGESAPGAHPVYRQQLVRLRLRRAGRP